MYGNTVLNVHKSVMGKKLMAAKLGTLIKWAGPNLLTFHQQRLTVHMIVKSVCFKLWSFVYPIALRMAQTQ